MRKVYDEFIQQKPKEMSKTLEDIAFKYINPETQQPTKVPAAHFEKELGQEIERAIRLSFYPTRSVLGTCRDRLLILDLKFQGKMKNIFIKR